MNSSHILLASSKQTPTTHYIICAEVRALVLNLAMNILKLITSKITSIIEFIIWKIINLDVESASNHLFELYNIRKANFKSWMELLEYSEFVSGFD